MAHHRGSRQASSSKPRAIYLCASKVSKVAEEAFENFKEMRRLASTMYFDPSGLAFVFHGLSLSALRKDYTAMLQSPAPRQGKRVGNMVWFDVALKLPLGLVLDTTPGCRFGHGEACRLRFAAGL